MLPIERRGPETNLSSLLPEPGVLIADNDKYFRAPARRLLEPFADSLADGLSRLRSEKVALVALDIIMPDRNGIEGMRAIKSMHLRLVPLASLCLAAKPDQIGETLASLAQRNFEPQIEAMSHLLADRQLR